MNSNPQGPREILSQATELGSMTAPVMKTHNGSYELKTQNFDHGERQLKLI